MLSGMEISVETIVEAEIEDLTDTGEFKHTTPGDYCTYGVRVEKGVGIRQ